MDVSKQAWKGPTLGLILAALVGCNTSEQVPGSAPPGQTVDPDATVTGEKIAPPKEKIQAVGPGGGPAGGAPTVAP